MRPDAVLVLMMRTRFACADIIDAIHLCASGMLCFGWLMPSMWRFHVLVVLATLAGWAGFKMCPISALSAALRGSRRPRFLALHNVRVWVLSWGAPVLGTGRPMDGECDLAGVCVLCAAVCVSLYRAGVPEATPFALLLLSGFTVARATAPLFG
jgi:hypothetical protein